MMFLLDTNIISELTRSKPNQNVINWSAKLSEIRISVITVDEIYYGLAWKPNSRIKVWFDTFIDSKCLILPVTPTIAKVAGQLRGRLQSQGKPRTQADMMIAATAQIHQLTLVTRNTRDFEGCGIRFINPFLAE
ncbi:type II toxin-antitoxin system VapC family toxin [Roseofilum capinflatum]|uniref:Type II toxin-antitoxin system VapC family toxin n=1 Tax=Roseofilum capinflatum BLCC-M114 TaxID=3022440 RepID=A0ABT7B228_9CYAN|nr:type II toxin-antitoxin system VapC family toxin [Roseofilum capinflatum]MDJ1173219.1 type II toxin-antitoxin system VapC family toxin [Roseofilum capinflatum BLCC-M114]